MYFLEMACRIQVDALAAGQWVRSTPANVAEKTAEMISKARFASRMRLDGMLEWAALRRQLDRSDPGYAD